jgi:hypothetical protein
MIYAVACLVEEALAAESPALVISQPVKLNGKQYEISYFRRLIS